MKRHRVVILVSALVLCLVGVLQLVRSATWERRLHNERTDTFVHRFYGPNKDVDYVALFDFSFRTQMELAAVLVAYRALLGVTFLLVGLMLVAVLGDTRVRRKTVPTVSATREEGAGDGCGAAEHTVHRVR